MTNKNIVSKSVIALLVLFLSFGFVLNAHASEEKLKEHSKELKEKEAEQESMDVGKLIIHHVSDGYEFHIFSVGKYHLTVPLPVILYDKGKWITFWSSEFHHHNGFYKGYYIAEDGMNAGKIVRKGADGKEVLPKYDLSITKTVFTLWVNSIILLIIVFITARSFKKRKGKAPKGVQSLMEPLIIFIRDEVALSSIGEKHYLKYTPYLLTLFFFILLNNLMGIVPFFPWGVGVDGNIGITAVMAVFTFIITTFSGNKHYWKDIFNTPGVPWWLKFPIPLMPIVEVMGMFTKPIVLAIRLFANMIAGHAVVLGFVALIFIFGKIGIGVGYGVSVVSVLFSIFLDILEVLISFIQAYVFVILSALYFGMAVEESH